MGFSTQYITDLTDRINATNSCAELQKITHEVMGPLNTQITALEAQVTALAPFLALVTGPTDLPSVLTWIGNLIAAQIQPQVTAYGKLAGQIAALTTAVTSLTSAINSAASRIGNCTVTIP